MIPRIAPARIAAVTRELLRREEYVTMGRFVGHLHDDAVRATFDVLDDVALLRVAFVLEQKESLEHLISLLPPRAGTRSSMPRRQTGCGSRCST